jgi:hypothetical protein
MASRFDDAQRDRDRCTRVRIRTGIPWRSARGGAGHGRRDAGGIGTHHTAVFRQNADAEAAIANEARRPLGRDRLEAVASLQSEEAARLPRDGVKGSVCLTAPGATFVRREIWSLAPDDPVVTSYAKAVDDESASHDRPDQLGYQAAIHGSFTRPAQPLWT